MGNLRKTGKLAVLFGFSLFLISCERVGRFRDDLDRWSFALSGGTMFSDPFQVTTKQLHLDAGDLFGKDVILEGHILVLGAEQTHLVLSDGEGRMLVVLTELEGSYRDLEKKESYRLRVLGRLERGKKGLPYILAHAIRLTEDASALSISESEQQRIQTRGKVTPAPYQTMQ